MKCKKCESQNVKVQAINKISLKRKHHGAVYWVLVGWWLRPTLWLTLGIVYLMYRIFKPKKYKTINKVKSIAVCQDCGNNWEI